MSAAKGWGGMPPPWLAKNQAVDAPNNPKAPAFVPGKFSEPAAPKTAAKPATTKPAPRHFEASEAYGNVSPEFGDEPTLPEELVDYHADLARYHHQAMAHHFAMMFHHSNLAAEGYITIMGPEIDLRVYRPEIPEIPMLPDAYHLKFMQEGAYPATHAYDMDPAQYRDYKYVKEPAVPGMPEEEEDGGELALEEDPQLTEEEQLWLNSQINTVITDQVEKELEQELAEEAEAEAVPEMICEDETAPTSEEVARFIEQVDVMEAMSQPIESIYVPKSKETEDEGDDAKAGSGDAGGSSDDKAKPAEESTSEIEAAPTQGDTQAEPRTASGAADTEEATAAQTKGDTTQTPEDSNG